MKLNEDKLTPTLYKWFYNTEVPTNFCPYFWRVCIMYIAILPVTILGLPPILFFDNPWSKVGDRENNTTRVLFGLLCYMALFFLFALVSVFFTITKTYPKDGFWDITRQLGVSIWFVIIVFSLYVLTCLISNKIKEKRRNKRHTKTNSIELFNYEPKKYLLVEFVKAKYKRYCPKIEWTSNKKS